MSHFSPTYFSTGYTSYYPYRQYEEASLKGYRMKLLGTGTVRATPDIVKASLGVITENKELKVSQEENSIKTNNVINTLKKMGIKEEDTRTESYSITLVYDYVEGKKIFRGYKVANNLSITIRNIEETGKIIDASVDAGANIVNDISFEVANPDKYNREALNLAIYNAIEKAKGIEKTFKINVNKIPIRIDEESLSYVPAQRTYLSSAESETPIMPGMLEFNAKVEAVFSYYD